MKKSYKIAIIGFGSIANRHLYNIISILQQRNIDFTIDLIRSGKGKELTDDIKSIINQVYYSYEKTPSDYDIVFIANPTHLHFDTIKKFAPRTKHMFIEKPVFDKSNVEIEELPLKEESIYYVACPLRYTSLIQHIKRHCDLSMVYAIRVICSSYLPEWRPNVDYRTSYSANKSQGGGVSIDLIHEWDYIHYLFGQPIIIYNVRGKFSDLDIDSDDLSIYIAKYEKMAVEVHLDYFGRKAIREMLLFSENETIVGDFTNNEIRYLKSGENVIFQETRNDYQLREIEYFFDIIEGKKKNHNDIYFALNTLKMTEAKKI